MEKELDHIVYSKNVLEFVTVANEYCNQIEAVEEMSVKELITLATRILPLVYLKAVVLPKVEFVLDESIEKTIREEDYIRVQHTLLNKLGEYDDYLEVFVPDNEQDQGDVASSVSENLADIYQDLKDFLFAYKIGVTDIMNDALAELNNAFELYWGQKLVNVLRACHNLLYSNKDLDEESLYGSSEGESTNNWFNKFQDQWQEGED
ncbi:DUF5063 domain-containing protein [Labilibacter marinus]|uniref:DUF5063 domain-containing protein n=1 Tax=Labilibacter marinus TaxID=1477105 RepID=UPI00082D42CC|nr:DUF5063 domain-containing protein [Labilibacter marinus]